MNRKKCGILTSRGPSPTDDFINQCQQHGWQMIDCPAYHIEHNNHAQQTLCTDWPKLDLIICTSQHAAGALSALTQQNAATKKIIAIGPQTKQICENAGFETTSAPAPYGSEALLKHPLLQDIANTHIGLICGENPRNILPKALATRGAQVKTYAVYKREAQPTNKLASAIEKNWDHINLITAGSVEQYDALKQACIHKKLPHWQKKPWVFLSQRIANQAASDGLERMYVAKTSDQSGWLNCLEQAANDIAKKDPNDFHENG